MDPILTTAVEAAEAAAAVHRRHAGRVDAGGAYDKGHQDWVSHVDVEAQEAALGVIRRRHPDHAILAEEEGEGHGNPRGNAPDGRPGEGALWIVDPLDGTTNFLHGHPEYCASVAVWVDGEPHAACVVGSRGERYTAMRGKGAYKGGRSISVSEPRTMERSLVGTGFPFKRLELLDDYLAQFARLLPKSSGIRRHGSAALDLCYLAEGRLDAFWELYLAPWDIAAGVLIVREAGGVVTGWDGSPAGLETGPVLAANSERLRAELRAIVGG